MNRKIISSVILLLLFAVSISTVSAALCKGKDGYYHDCKNYDSYCDDYYTGDLNWFRETKCKEKIDKFDADEDYFVYHEWSGRTPRSRYTYKPRNYYTVKSPEYRYVTYDYETVYSKITQDLFGFHNHFKIDSRTIPRYPSNIRYNF